MQPRSCQEGERPRESPCLPCAFTPLAGSLKTTKTDKKHGSRQEAHPLSDRPEIDWPCRPEYDATISFGLLFEPEDSQYGKFRVASRSRGHDHAVVVEVWVGVGPSRHDPFPLSAPTLREAPALLRKIGVWATQVRNCYRRTHAWISAGGTPSPSDSYISDATHRTITASPTNVEAARNRTTAPTTPWTSTLRPTCAGVDASRCLSGA